MPDLKITASVKAASPPASARAHAAAEDGVDPANFAALLLEQVDGPSARTSGDGDAAAGLPGASTGAGTGAGKRDKASAAHDLALVAGGALPPVAASSASLPVQAPAAGSVPSSIDRSRAVPPDSTAGMAGSTAGSGVADAGPGAPRQTRFVELSPAAGYARPGEPGAFQVDAADESRAGADSAAGAGLPSPGSDVPRARAGQAPPHENASVAGAPAVRAAAAGSAAAAAAPPSSLPWSPAGDAVPDSTLRVAASGMPMPAARAETLPSAEHPLPAQPDGAAVIPAAAPMAASQPPATVQIPTPVTSPHWAQDFAKAVTVTVRNGIQTAEIRVEPRDLGPISLSVTLSGNSAAINLTAAHADTRALLQSSLGQLRDALSASGIQLSGASVQADSSHQRGHSGFEQSSQYARWPATAASAAAPAAAPAAGAATASPPSQRRIVDTFA